MASLTRVTNQFKKSQKPETTEDFFSHLKLSPSTSSYEANKKGLDSNEFSFQAYRHDNGKPFLFRAVEKAQQEIVDQKMDKEYTSMEGIATFNDVVQKFLFGENHPLVRDKKIVTFQTLSAIGALRVGLEFLSTHMEAGVLLSEPTGECYVETIQRSRLSYAKYPYLDPKSMELDFDGICRAFSAAKPGTILILNAAAHNPTGVDPTPEQWRILAKLAKSKGLLPFFDSSSQGLASGNLDNDVRPIHIFLEEGLQMLIAQSFSKNMGLYGDRVGAIHIVCTSSDIAHIVATQLNLTVRCMYGIPPIHGGRIVEKILRNPQYKAEWKQDLQMISDRLKQTRALLFAEIKALNIPGNWSHITKQTGLYWYTGLTMEQNETLAQKHKIPFIKQGRMNISYVNQTNVNFIARAIKDVVQR